MCTNYYDYLCINCDSLYSCLLCILEGQKEVDSCKWNPTYKANDRLN